MSDQPVGVGVIGAGYISDIYLTNLASLFDAVRVVGVADLVAERARAQAAKYGIAALTIDDLLAHPEIEVVVNLTIPQAHAEVAFAAVRAGKSIYNEKPLTMERAESEQLLAEAAAKGLLVGCAPDTFLGGGLQTARELLDGGIIGEPVAFRATMITHGHEHWHPNPEFYYQAGVGPMFDMGPYYVTALAMLLGPVREVTSLARASFPERTITSQQRYGETFAVQTPTHIVANLGLQSGVIGTLTTTFDLWDTTHAAFVVYGSEGTLRLPDPNTFGGPISLLPAGSEAWEELPITHGYTENSRGLGVADLARALREGGTPRASGKLAQHVLDVMQATLDSAARGERVCLTTTAERPEPLSS
ncbi:MAG TPA: Gfo/Idh/MocA family oxidoreductase [Thermomicrobiales bacterium]|nr:Gfo/Idh/MocA family oxidoreductase [Thermomicrobiales bacterium]